MRDVWEGIFHRFYHKSLPSFDILEAQTVRLIPKRPELPVEPARKPAHMDSETYSTQVASMAVTWQFVSGDNLIVIPSEKISNRRAD